MFDFLQLAKALQEISRSEQQLLTDSLNDTEKEVMAKRVAGLEVEAAALKKQVKAAPSNTSRAEFPTAGIHEQHRQAIQNGTVPASLRIDVNSNATADLDTESMDDVDAEEQVR